MVSGPGNRFQSELELKMIGTKRAESVVEQSGVNRRQDVGREIHIGLHCCFSYFCYCYVIAVASVVGDYRFPDSLSGRLAWVLDPFRKASRRIDLGLFCCFWV